MFCCANILPAPLQMCMEMCLHQDVTGEGKKAKLRSSKIEQHLSEQARNEKNVVKILMLGAAESGKSTLIKQIKIIHSHGFSKQELISFKPAIMDNLLNSMKFVLRGMGMLRINLASKKNKIHARAILSHCECLGDDQELLPFVAHAFCALWADQGVRAAAARGYEFELNDSALYLYDVGVQRSDRRKWLRCFDGIQVLLFVVALSSYDLSLPKDTTVNPLQESCGLFTSICTNAIFKLTSVILFMNKADLFQEKILHSGRHLRFYISTFQGADADVDAAARHITAMFSTCGGDDRLIFHHFTTATDTTNVRVVLQVAVEQILEQNLATAQLL
ncbi:guanine nucleotide-binding protein G(o) subunit alpha-like isoform X2 [Vanacampus margaritifer]